MLPGRTGNGWNGTRIGGSAGRLMTPPRMGSRPAASHGFGADRRRRGVEGRIVQTGMQVPLPALTDDGLVDVRILGKPNVLAVYGEELVSHQILRLNDKRHAVLTDQNVVVMEISMNYGKADAWNGRPIGT